MTARRSPPWLLGLLSLASLGAIGCAHTLDMAEAYDATRPAATIPYAGVREETRLYPDYSALKGDILTDPPSDPAPAPKKGRGR